MTYLHISLKESTSGDNLCLIELAVSKYYDDSSSFDVVHLGNLNKACLEILIKRLKMERRASIEPGVNEYSTVILV